MNQMIRILFISFLFLLSANLFAQTFSSPTILDPLEEESQGVSFGDYDNDGWVDLYISRGNASNGNSYLNILMRNINGTLTKQTISGITDINRTSGTCTWGDYDNDGDLDLYVANAEAGFGAGKPRNTLILNDGDGTFTDKTNDNAYGPIVTATEDARVVGWGDSNNDGFIDVYVKKGNIAFFGETGAAGSFFLNSSGTGSSAPGSGTIGDLITDGPSNIYRNLSGSFGWSDFDNDGDMDIYSARGSTKDNTLWRNTGGKFFDDTPAALRPTQTSTQAFSWGDYDNDGDMDLFTGTKPEASTKHSFLFRNNSSPDSPNFTDVTAGDLLSNEFYIRGSAWADVDNDGDLDLFTGTVNDAVHENPDSRLYTNSGASGSYSLTETLTFDLADNDKQSFARGVAFADIDNDGDMDFVVGRFYEPLLYTNTTSNGFAYTNIKLVGVGGNASAIGTQVFATANIPQQSGATTQMREISGQTGAGGQSDMRAHFGFGTATKIDNITVKWLNTSGGTARTEQTYTDLPLNKFMVFTQSGSASVIKQQNLMYLVGNTGAAVEFESNTDTDGGSLSIVRNNTDPGNAGYSGSALSPDGSTISPNVVSPDRYWVISETGLTGNFTAEVYFDISGMGGITNADKLVIVRRANSGAAWEAVNTQRTGNTLRTNANLTTFAEYAIASNLSDNSLPVELAAFKASFIQNGVALNWTTASELDNVGFIIERSMDRNDVFVEIASYKSDDRLNGQGNSSAATNYTYVDSDVLQNRTYYYRLSDVSVDGVKTMHSVIEVDTRIKANGFKLHANYPNPFNPSTTIVFDVPEQAANGAVRLAIYNSAGALVKELANGNYGAGRYTFNWSGENRLGIKQASGIYYAHFVAKGYNKTIKMMLLK